MNLKKISLGLAALIVAFGLVFSMSAFKQAPVKKEILRYQYKNSDATDINQVTSWDDLNSLPQQDCEEGEDLPCVIEINTSTSPYNSLADYLSAHSTLGAIMASDEVTVKKSF